MTVVNLNPDLDTRLHGGTPDASFGTDDELHVQGSNPQQSLIRFDLSGIPAGSTINSATLTFVVTDVVSTAGFLTAFHKMLTTWSGTSTYNSLTGGISADGVEAESSADFTFEFSTLGSMQITVPAAAIQDWIDGQTNHGWAMLPGWGGADLMKVWSNEGTTAPVLSIDYTAPAAEASYELTDYGFFLPDGVGV